MDKIHFQSCRYHPQGSCFASATSRSARQFGGASGLGNQRLEQVISVIWVLLDLTTIRRNSTLSEDHNWEFDTVRGSSFASAQVDDSDAHEGPSTIRDYASSNLPSSLRLLFGDSLPNQQDDYRPLPSHALTISPDTQFISQTPVREVDDIPHSSLLSEPVVRPRTHPGEVASSHGSVIFPAEGSLDSSATSQSPKIVDGSLVDNEPKDDLGLASTAPFQFPVDSKQAIPRQSTSRVTQRQASPTPCTAVNHLNAHQNALSLDTSSSHDIPLIPRTRSATTPPPMLNMERDFLTSTHKTPNPIDRTLRLNSSGKLLNLGTPGLKDVLKVWPLLEAAVQLLIGKNLRFLRSHLNIILD